MDIATSNSDICLKRLQLSRQIAFPIYLILRAVCATVGVVFACSQAKKQVYFSYLCSNFYSGFVVLEKKKKVIFEK